MTTARTAGKPQSKCLFIAAHLSSRHRTHDPHPMVRGSASAVVAAAYNQSGADYIAYARQCRAFGLSCRRSATKTKCGVRWHAPEIRDLGALLERRKSINCWHPPARKILLR